MLPLNCMVLSLLLLSWPCFTLPSLTQHSKGLVLLPHVAVLPSRTLMLCGSEPLLPIPALTHGCLLLSFTPRPGRRNDSAAILHGEEE